MASAGWFGFLTEDDKRFIEPKVLKRGEYFLKQGEAFNQYGFVLQGSLRVFVECHNGNQHLINVLTEGNGVYDAQSIVTQTSAQFNIEALEDCRMLCISKQHLQLLTAKYPALNRMLEMYIEDDLIRFRQRMHQRLSLPATDRLNVFMQAQPKGMQRFSQITIAAYLGVTPETLSRIRRKMIIKNSHINQPR